MGRRAAAPVRKIAPDPLYHNLLVAKLINQVMVSGKKSIAQKLVYQALEEVKEKTKKEALDVLIQAIESIKPRMEVRSRRVGGAAYQVPSLVRGRRRESLAIRWLINSARKRSSKEHQSFAGKLAEEIIDAANKQGGAVQKKEEMEKIAEANRAFAHLRW